MDIQPATNQASKPISDDQELAKVLAGISKDTNTDLKFDDDPEPPKAMGPIAPPVPPAIPPLPPINPAFKPAAPAPDPADDNDDDTKTDEDSQPSKKEPAGFTFDESMMPKMPPAPMPPAPTASDTNLDGIRKDALLELRPLVDKLDLAPEEKFDIYLLLLRSTDDTTLIAPAHEAAKSIADESKRAEALLDVIKEIDFLSAPVAPK